MSRQVEVITYHIEVENRRDLAEMLGTLDSENPVRDEVAGLLYMGRDAVAARYQELWEAFPDFCVKPVRFTEQGKFVAMEALFSGTHRGTYRGQPGRGRRFEIRLVNVFEFSELKICRETIYSDLGTQLRQLEIA